MANTNPIRDLGYLAWSNDLAWMEGQSGNRWLGAIKKENSRFTRAIRPLEPLVRRFKKDLEDPKDGKANIWKWKGWTIEKSEYSPIETWSLKGFSVKAWDADANSGFFAAAVPVEGGYERFNLNIYSIKPMKLIKTIEKVGPFVAFINKDTLAYLGSSADHRYDSLHIVSLDDMVDTLLYELTDSPKIHNLELRRAEDGSIYVIKSDFVTEELGIVSKDHVNWVTKASKIIVLAHDTWIKDGKTSLGLPIQTPSTDYLEAISLKAGWAITLSHGIRTLWRLGSKDYKTKAMVYVWGEIHYDVRDPDRLCVYDMRYEPYTIHTTLNLKSDWKLTKTESHPYVCAYYNAVAPTFVVTGQQFSGSAKGLLVTAYGAYGTPTKIGRLVQRWRPLLNAGWAIASVTVPGSGDHDLTWRFQGQAKGRKLAIDTLCATVKDLQEELGVGPAQTALYGRSAGGLLVSATLNVCKGLVGAIYMESPYVDTLRTITNPKLPLTVLETKEFGIGTNPASVISTGAWSPMEHIPSEGYPDIFVVARTDAADLEVYPYEVLKYITRVRGQGPKRSGQPKLLYISADKGHFTTDQETRAEDLALLDNWLSETTTRGINKNRINKYKMMPARRNMTRKNKNNAMMRKNKNKNNTMMRKNKNRKNKNRTNKNRRNRH